MTIYNNKVTYAALKALSTKIKARLSRLDTAQSSFHSYAALSRSCLDKILLNYFTTLDERRHLFCCCSSLPVDTSEKIRGDISVSTMSARSLLYDILSTTHSSVTVQSCSCIFITATELRLCAHPSLHYFASICCLLTAVVNISCSQLEN